MHDHASGLYRDQSLYICWLFRPVSSPVCGFGVFGLTLRCVALLCGVFVRLHLALFLAGGPFLPSLYVNL
jgi:hypothetical protein